MAIVWSALEDAIRAWVVTSSGLAEGQVIWAQQDGDAPSTNPYITIRLGDLTKPGGPDALRNTYNAQTGLIDFRTQGPREFVVSVQAFADDTVGDTSARALMDKVQTYLGLPSIRDALNDAGLGVLDEGQVKVVSAIYGTDFEDRAVLEVKFMTTATATESVEYIATVEIEDSTDSA